MNIYDGYIWVYQAVILYVYHPYMVYENIYGIPIFMVGIYVLLCLIGNDPSVPIFEPYHPVNTTVREGQSATFQCRVRSQEKPVLQWIKVIDDPSHLDFNQSVEVHGLHITVLDRKFASDTVDFRNSTYSKLLYIPVTAVVDAGWYVCVVTSQKGHLSHRFAYLNVLSGKRGVPNE